MICSDARGSADRNGFASATSRIWSTSASSCLECRTLLPTRLAVARRRRGEFHSLIEHVFGKILPHLFRGIGARRPGLGSRHSRRLTPSIGCRAHGRGLLEIGPQGCAHSSAAASLGLIQLLPAFGRRFFRCTASVLANASMDDSSRFCSPPIARAPAVWRRARLPLREPFLPCTSR